MTIALKSLLTVAILLYQVGGNEIRLVINGSAPIYITDSKSPSVALGMGIFKYGWTKYLNNTKLLTLVGALGPSYIRVGGTKSDHSFFHRNETHPFKYHQDLQITTNCTGTMPNFTEFNNHRMKAYSEEQIFFQRKSMGKLSDDDLRVDYTGPQFDDLLRFVKCAGWDLIFGLNLLSRDAQRWDPTNSLELLGYAKRKRYRISWELGNEPNSYPHKTGLNLTAVDVAKAFYELNNILKSDSWWKDSPIVGPDVNGFMRPSSKRFLKKFLDYAGKKVDAVTFHQYYIDSRVATIHNFTDPKVLNILLPQVKDAVRIVQREQLPIPVWLGETSSSYGGGAKGLSDTFVAGFLWLDKLGMCAANSIGVVFRQTLLEGNYALLDDNFDPRPDYWLTLLYKRLVGRRVLNVTKVESLATAEHPGKFRVYAHCANTMKTKYAPGSVTVYYLNLSTKNKSLSILPNSRPKLRRAMVYILTSSPLSLNSSDVYLNGAKLQMTSAHSLPVLLPKVVPLNRVKIKLPSMSFGFIVLPDLKVRACQ